MNTVVSWLGAYLDERGEPMNRPAPWESGLAAWLRPGHLLGFAPAMYSRGG
jgi:hypothetical protein